MKPDRRRLRLLVLAGGAFGTLLRFAASEFIAPAAEFPWSTLLVNVIGSLGLGYLVGRSLSHAVPLTRIAFIGVGILGAMTTFGGAMVQVVALLEERSIGSALAYLSLSVTLGMTAALATLRAGASR